MKKSFKILYIAIFFLLCCLPAALLPVAPDNGEIEKRALTEWPAYLEEGRLNLSFSDRFESALNDRIPFRAQLLTAANFLKGEVLHAATSNVVVGKEGWLFFQSEVGDYLGSSNLTDQQIRAMAVTLSLIQEGVEAGGGVFSFVPMPNKSTVYGELLPAAYRQAEVTNLSRLTAALREEGVNFVDMAGAFAARKQEGLLYHARDSHWNYRGALMGAELILDSLGREHPDYEAAAFTVRKDWRGDLDKLLYPAGGTLDDQVYYDVQHDDFFFTHPRGVKDQKAQLANFMSDREDRDDLFSTRNRVRKDGSRLFMARDSFGRALLPYMIDGYENATFKRTDCPDLASLAEGTDVVYEIAERNLNRVIGTAPFLFAPERPSPDLGGLARGGEIRALVETGGYGFRLCGALPEEAELGDSRICLILETEAGTLTLEAFPIYETRLLGEGGTKGFSAYVSRDRGLSGPCHLTVIAGGKTYTCDVTLEAAAPPEGAPEAP